jgi:hypothetical protein
VGQPDSGRTLEHVKRDLQTLAPPQKIEFMERLSIDEVTALQLRSKVGAVFSLHEGGCVAAVETLMAGAALCLPLHAHIGSSAHINERTGRFLRPGSEAADLRQTVEQYADFRPREYAEQHISCHVSGQKLNEALKKEALVEGRPWTQDIQVPHYRPYPRLWDNQNHVALATAAQELSQRYPLVFAPDFMANSHR